MIAGEYVDPATIAPETTNAFDDIGDDNLAVTIPDYGQYDDLDD
jgi:hypothetical protein